MPVRGHLCSSDFRPDVDFVAAAKTCFFDCLAGRFAASVSAEVQGFFACSRHNLVPVDRYRAVYSLAGFFYRLEVYAYFRDGIFDASGCRTDDEDLVADIERV